MDADIGPDTRRFWSHQELAAGLGLSRGHLYRLAADGCLLEPDIEIAKGNYGWDPRRAQRFGVDTDRLTADFKPIGYPPEGTAVSAAKARTLAKTRYKASQQVYLSSWLASFVYGFKPNAVYFMRKRDGFIPADVVIAGKFGWSEERVIEFGEQTGRLNDIGIDRWAVRRTAYYGLSPQAGWVQARIAARPHLQGEVEAALQAWEEAEAAREAEEAAQAESARTAKTAEAATSVKAGRPKRAKKKA